MELSPKKDAEAVPGSTTPLFARSASDWAIRVESLGKRYRLGGPKELNQNFREDLVRWLSDFVYSPWRRPALNDFWALREIDLEVRRGEIVGLLGANGAGKSTLLKILSRITAPTVGTVRYRGRLAGLLEVGTGFHRELTGRENIFLNGAILGMTRAEIREQLSAIVDFAGIGAFLDTPVKHYSSGMYVRLAFAVAAHLRADILVVDEVLAVGDAHFQRKCLGQMQAAAHQGRTVIFVSHNAGAVRELCQSAALLRQGRIVARGTVDECLRAYLPQAEVHTLQFDVAAGRPGLKSVRLEVQDTTLVVGLEVVQLAPGSNPHPELILHDDHGRPLCGTNPKLHPFAAALPIAPTRFDCRLDLSSLRSGEYRLSVQFSTSQAGRETHDQSLAFRFENPLTPSRIPPASHYGSFLAKASWDFEEPMPGPAGEESSSKVAGEF